MADEALPKSRRQQKEELSGPRNDDYIPPPRESNLKRKREEAEHDPKLKEYLDVMQPRSKTTLWANEEAQVPHAGAPAPAVQSAEDVEFPAAESDDEYQVLSKKPKTARSTPPVEPQPVVDTSMVDSGDAEITNAENINEEKGDDTSPVDQGPVSDADWLRSRTNRVLDLVEDDDDDDGPSAQTAVAANVPAPQQAAQVDEQPETSNTPAEPVVNTAPSEEDKIRQTGRLYLRNLSYLVTEEDLRGHFSKYGPLDEVRRYWLFLFLPVAMMNNQIGTTDALHMRSTWESILVDVSLI